MIGALEYVCQAKQAYVQRDRTCVCLILATYCDRRTVLKGGAWMRWRNRLIGTAGAILTVLAILDQLGRRAEDRDWHGRILGIPYDFRMPTVERLQARIWN